MSNLKVILLDDEMLIRKLIRMKMNTEELGLEIVGEFSNAKSALEKIGELKPDIILSDICMPEMDGLSFGEQCTKLLPGVKIIIVTGYNDFEYARRSLQVGVFDYLMKPVQSVELNKTLEKAIAQIKQEREQQQRQQKLKNVVEKGILALRRSYINQLLLSDCPPMDMDSMLAEYGIEVNPSEDSEFCVALIAIQESFMTPDVVNIIYAEVCTFFQGDAYVNVTLDVWGRIIIISEESECCFAECFALLLQDIGKKHDYHVITGLSEKFSGWKDIRVAYLSALDDMQRNHQNKEEEQTMEKAYDSENSSEQSRWLLAVEYIKRNQLKEAISEVEKMLYDSPSQQDMAVRKQQIMEQLMQLCEAVGLSEKADIYCDMTAGCRQPSDIDRCIPFIVMDMTLLKGKEADTEKGQLMLQIVRYIKANLKKPTLAMNDLVDVFSCSSSYISRLFRQYMGRTYGEYLSDLRLFKMLSLLASDSEMKDRDIGEQIGITDAHYLSIWFRKMTGYSVTEYRKLTR